MSSIKLIVLIILIYPSRQSPLVHIYISYIKYETTITSEMMKISLIMQVLNKQNFSLQTIIYAKFKLQNVTKNLNEKKKEKEMVCRLQSLKVVIVVLFYFIFP